MTVIHTGSVNWGEMLLTIFGSLIVICILLLIFLNLIKKADNSKPLFTKQCKIIEKKLSNGNIEWYVVEMEDGERVQLRNFRANTMIISEGDCGEISYRGKTISSFKRV